MIDGIFLCLLLKLYNSLIDGGLSPKSVKNTHRCLHKALEIAVRVSCIAKNPTEACILPRITQKEITPLDTPDLTKLMKYLEGHEHEALFKTALFTGMRSGELLGLTWDCVDFEVGVIHVKKQLLQPRKLFSHLREIDSTCNARMEQMVKQMAKVENVTESLKAENQMEWVARMNGIQNRAEETILEG